MTIWSASLGVLAGAAFTGIMYRWVTRAPVVPPDPWCVDPDGALVNLRHLRVVDTDATGLYGEWAEPALLDDPLIHLAEFDSPDDADLALHHLSSRLRATRLRPR